MNEKSRKAMTKSGILISILIITSMLTFLTTSSFAVAENPEAIVIARGKATAYNYNNRLYSPWEWYGPEDNSPIIMAARRIDLGAVVASGIAASLRNDRWDLAANPDKHLDVLLDVAFQWMKPGATKVLWFQGYGVYNNTTRCSNLVAALKDKGYTVTGDSTTPITSAMLAPYDILVIPQLQLGATGTGGDPDLLENADVQAIKSFVEEGGGLLIVESPDHYAEVYDRIQNKVLKALDFGLYFQNDTVYDNINNWGGPKGQPIVDVITATDIGSDYQASTGKTTIGLYNVCSLASNLPPTFPFLLIVETTPTQSPQVTPGLSPTIVAQRPGENIQTVVRVTNLGEMEDTFTISASDDLGWNIEVSPMSLTLPGDGKDDVVVKITVDPMIEDKIQNLVRITATGTYAEDTTVLSTAPYFPLTESPYPLLPDSHPLVRKNPYFYQFSSTSLIVEPPAQPIIIGTETANTLDETGPREPYPIPFRWGEFPVIAAADEVENGRVIVYGPGPSFRSIPTDHFNLPPLRMKELSFDMIGWLVHWENAAQHKVLFYWTTGAFHDAERCPGWIDYLLEMGYTVHTYTGEITAARLAPYSMLMFIGPERDFTSAERAAIRDWVRAGGGLFISDQADYQGYGMATCNNSILEDLGVNIRQQDDQVTDNVEYNRWPWDLRVYLVDHPVWYPPLAVSADMEPEAQTKNAGEKATFILTIFNDGTETDTYKIEDTSVKGWPFVLEHEEVTLAGGHVENIEIVADALPVENLRRENMRFDRNDYIVKVTGTGASAETSFRLTVEMPEVVSLKYHGR